MHPTLKLLERNLGTLQESQNLLVINPPDTAIFQLLDNPCCVTTDFSFYRSCATNNIHFGLEFDHCDFDAAIVFMPKSKKELDLISKFALSKLSSGSLYLVGEKKSGIESGAKRLKSEGELIKLDSAKHCQLWQLGEIANIGGEFTIADWFAHYSFSIADRSYQIATIPGVFSQDGLDPGTELLLQSIFKGALKKPAGRMLDFGCGSGVLGIVAKSLYPDIEVESVDTNWMALECAKQTASLNGVELSVYPSDGWSNVEGRVDGVVSNPPFHKGIDTDYSITERFIGEAPRKLNKFGPFLLVANHFLKYAGPIERAFSYCETLEQNSKFKVYYTSR